MPFQSEAWVFPLWLLALLFAPPAQAQQVQPRFVQERQELVNWYYAATYGTGVYAAGDRTVGVLQIPLSYTLREPGEDQWGLKLTFPLSFGFYGYDFDSLVSQGLPDRLSTVSLVPGLELEKQITSRWRLRPYVSAGAGRELEGDEYAWIYDVGLRSRFRIAEDQGVEFALVNRLSVAGYEVHNGPKEPLGYLAVGLDVTVPTGAEVFGRQLIFSITPAYYYYFRRLRFPEFNDAENSVAKEAEFAVSILTRRPFSFAGIEMDRIGIAVRSGDGVTGFRLFGSLPF